MDSSYRGRHVVDNCDDSDCGGTVHTNSLGTSLSYRPRSSLARALYHKQRHDEYLNQFDKKQWYQCNLNEMDQTLASKFVQLGPDDYTMQFLEQSERKSDWILTQIWHSLIKAVLGFFMNQTSINGWLQRGSMFVISQPQFRSLLKVEDDWSSMSLLDLGAGDGEVTSHIAPLFQNVFTTELSGTMKTLLQRRGFKVLDVDAWHSSKYNVISCLNLIDRCERPWELMDQIKNSLLPDGRVLLAVVLPFSAYVESAYPHHKPKELLPINGTYFEGQITSVVNDFLEPAGFEVVTWSRVPYLCEGDLQQSYYWLDDAVFVLKVKNA